MKVFLDSVSHSTAIQKCTFAVKKNHFTGFRWPHQIFFRNFNFFFFIKLSGFKGQNAQYFAVAKKIEKFFNFKFFSNYSHEGVFGSVSHSTAIRKCSFAAKTNHFPGFGWPHQIFFRNFNFFFFIKLSGFKGQNAQYFAVAKKIEKFFNFKFFSNYSHGGVFGSVSHSTAIRKCSFAVKKNHFSSLWLTPPEFFWEILIFFFSSNYLDLRVKTPNILRSPKKSKNFSISNFSPTIVTEVFLAPSVTQQLYENVVLQSKKITFPVFGWPHQIFFRNFNFFFSSNYQDLRVKTPNILRSPKKSKNFSISNFSPTIVTEVFLAPSVTQQLSKNVVLQSKKITFPVFGWPHQNIF